MKKSYLLFVHVFVWFAILLNGLLPAYFNNSFASFANRPPSFERFVDYTLVELGYLSMSIIAFYSSAYFIAPAFFKQRNILKGISYCLILFSFQPAYRYLLEYHFFLPHLGFDNYFGKTPDMLWYVKNIVLFTFYGYFLYGFFYFFILELMDNHKREKALKNEKIATELAFLKSQINPHFLFNTLNDIYSLSYRQSPDAPDSLLKLSALLRYMLKESDEEWVLLEKEIEYLRNLIELHKIGQKGDAHIDFEVLGEAVNHKIAPLILINFVENAFKHGVSDDLKHPIKILIKVETAQLKFSVRNLKNNDQKDNTSGIGLINVKRRLSLIYPNKYQLSILEDEKFFTINLQIEWK